MLSRNQIRQAALQYLYAASQTPETEQEGIWDILMEPFRGDYRNRVGNFFPRQVQDLFADHFRNQEALWVISDLVSREILETFF